MGPRPRLWFCACKTACISQEYKVSMGPSPHLWFCVFKTVTLAPQLQVSMGPRPLCGFVHSKQRLYDQN